MNTHFLTRLLCSATKAGRGVSQTAWIESGEATEGRDQRRGKHDENRHDLHHSDARSTSRIHLLRATAKQRSRSRATGSFETAPGGNKLSHTRRIRLTAHNGPPNPYLPRQTAVSLKRPYRTPHSKSRLVEVCPSACTPPAHGQAPNHNAQPLSRSP